MEDEYLFDIRDYGAVGDGKTDSTAAIQRAIEACAASGGGTVNVENGVYLTCPIRLRSYVELHLASNATLLGSPNWEDYHEWDELKGIDAKMLPRKLGTCLIFAESCHHVSLTGTGTIDCNGAHFVREREEPAGQVWKPFERINLFTPPRVVFFACCRKVRIEDVSIVNPPAGWSFWIHDCDDVCMTRLTVEADLRYPNNDGIHINSSRDVTVSDCNIQASDDAIVVRACNASLPFNKVCERVTVTNCNLISHCGAIRIGWLNDGIIRNCVFSNLTVTNTRDVVLITLPFRGPDRIPDEGREAIQIENLAFHAITADRIFGHPIRIKINEREESRIIPGIIRGLHFQGVHCRGLRWPSLEGRRDFPIEDVSFFDCTFERVPQDESFGPFVITNTKSVYYDGLSEVFGAEMFSCVKHLRLSNTEFTDR